MLVYYIEASYQINTFNMAQDKWCMELKDESERTNKEPRHIVFPKKDGDFNFMSMYYVEGFIHHGVTFPSMMHAKTFMKAKLMGDVESMHEVLKCKRPGYAREIGRRVKNFNVELWKSKHIDIIRSILHSRYKCEQDNSGFTFRSQDTIEYDHSACHTPKMYNCTSLCCDSYLCNSNGLAESWCWIMRKETN